MEKTVCIHHTDFDGHASAAIVGHCLGWNKVIFRAMNYDYDFPYDLVDQETTVCMVDFSLQPFERMVDLLECCAKFIWIDHHERAVEQYWRWRKEGKAATKAFLGWQSLDAAGCELTWDYFRKGYVWKAQDCPPDRAEHPRALTLLGRYDVWDQSFAPQTFEFQCGLRTLISDLGAPIVTPEDSKAKELWEALLFSPKHIQDFLVDKILDVGRPIYQHQRAQQAKRAQAVCFPTTFDGVPAIAANIGGADSTFFDGVLEKYPDARMGIMFRWGRGCWVATLYSLTGRDCPHLGEIAAKYGGGGHPGAAGFQVYADERLPFLELKGRPQIGSAE